MKKVFLLSVFLFGLVALPKVYAQYDSIIIKGRFSTSLFGFIDSQTADSKTNAFEQNTNGYLIGTKSGYFIADRVMIGLGITLTRSESVNSTYRFDEEQVLVGPMARWYFLHHKNIALYGELNPYFVSLYQELGSVDTNIINLETKGLGLGTSAGVGFVYFLNRHVGFSLHLDYFYSYVYADRLDRVNNISLRDDIAANKLRFSFGFQLYLDEFFF